ncbi:MAG TPA: ABC transporter permease, partial [Vicinamibacterales bacterium]|nr:ABC transporter permease [Vicinamibacterales bacterium]
MPARNLVTFVRGWLADARLSLRTIARRPAYAFVVVATITLAVGGVGAVFTLADPILFKPLPFREPDRLYLLSIRGRGPHGGGSYADYRALRAARAIESVGEFEGPILASVIDRDDLDAFMGYLPFEGYVDALGVAPAMGRLFGPDDYRSATAEGAAVTTRSIVITDRMWRSFFAADPAVVGRRIQVREFRAPATYEVIGVLRPDFVFPDLLNRAPDFLAPVRVDGLGNPNLRLTMLVRLALGATPESAAGEIQSLVRGVEQAIPQIKEPRAVTLYPLRPTLVESVRVPILMLLGTTAAILVLATGNLVHLCVTRSRERLREVAVRSALGAERWRVTRLLATEAIILAALGAAGALALGQLLFRAVMAVVPQFGHVYRLVPAGLDARVVGLSLMLSAGIVIVSGVLPAIWASRRDVRGALASTGRSVRGGRRVGDRVLTALQAALAVGVLITSMLLVGSFVRLVNSIDGIDLDGLSTVSLTLPDELAAPSARAQAHLAVQAFVDRVEAETGGRIGLGRGLPGVTLPAAIRRVTDPIDSDDTVIGYPVDATWMSVARLQLVRGRLFTDAEAAAGAPVAVLDERAARFLWPDVDPIGQLVRDHQTRPAGERAVVGVVRAVDVDFGRAPGQGRANGRAFVPLDPLGFSPPWLLWRGPVSDAFVDRLRQAATAVAPGAKVRVTPLEPFERRLGEPRLLARLMASLALLALLLT